MNFTTPLLEDKPESSAKNDKIVEVDLDYCPKYMLLPALAREKEIFPDTDSLSWGLCAMRRAGDKARRMRTVLEDTPSQHAMSPCDNASHR